MRAGIQSCYWLGSLWAIAAVLAQNGELKFPQSIEAGSAFSIQSRGNGKGTLYIVGPGQLIKHDVQLGETASFPAGSLYNAGHYIVVLASASSSQTGSLDVVPAKKPAELIFIAKPSRLPVCVAWRYHRHGLRIRQLSESDYDSIASIV